MIRTWTAWWFLIIAVISFLAVLIALAITSLLNWASPEIVGEFGRGIMTAIIYGVIYDTVMGRGK